MNQRLVPSIQIDVGEAPRHVVLRLGRTKTKLDHKEPQLMSTLARTAVALTSSLLVATLAQAQPERKLESMPEIVVASAAEDAEGITQTAFNLVLLKDFETRTLTSFQTKMRNYLKSQGRPTNLPVIRTEAHYMTAGGIKLAVVRLNAQQSVNQVYVYGIVGRELRRVVCARSSQFEESIPVFYGPCGEKIRETYGVSLQAK